MSYENPGTPHQPVHYGHTDRRREDARQGPVHYGQTYRRREDTRQGPVHYEYGAYFSYRFGEGEITKNLTP